MTADCYYEGMAAVLKVAGVQFFSPRELCRVGRFANGVGPGLEPPPASAWPHIVPTVQVLDDLRRYANGPVIVTSGYRDPAYNRAVGGASDSLHTHFNACDIQVPNMLPSEVYEWLRRHKQAHTFGLGLYSTFVHIDTRGTLGKAAPVRF